MEVYIAGPPSSTSLHSPAEETNIESMESFFQDWVEREEQFLEELLSAPRDHPERHLAAHRALVTRVLAHYHEYYQEKARLAAQDVLLLFSPPWLTPLERTFLWIAGWKPSLAFRLLSGSVDGLFSEQRLSVEELQRTTAAEERALAEEMARVQEAMAMPEVLRLARASGNGQVRTEAVEAVLASLAQLVASAEALRARTVTRLAELLTPLQIIDFLTAAAQLHLRLRGWGARQAGRAAPC